MINKWRRDFLIVAGATVIAGFANYLFQVVVGRGLGPEEFGPFGALFAVFYGASVAGAALQASVAEAAARYNALHGPETASAIILGFARKFAIIPLLITIAVAISYRQIAAFLGIQEPVAVLITAAAVGTALLWPIITGLLQGQQQFVAFAFAAHISPSVSKLIFGALFISMGVGFIGATLALPISGIFAFAVGIAFVLHKKNTPFQRTPDVATVRGLSLKGLGLTVFLFVPANVDMLVIAHSFPNTDAGLYNAIVTLGKLIIFLPMPLSLVLLPAATRAYNKGLPSAHLFLFSIAGLTFGLAPALGIYTFLPTQIITFILGEPYLSASQHLSFYGVAMCIFSMNMVVVYYNLAIQNNHILVAAAFFSLGEIALMGLYHETFNQIISVMLLTNVALLGIGLGEFVRTHTKARRTVCP